MGGAKVAASRVDDEEGTKVEEYVRDVLRRAKERELLRDEKAGDTHFMWPCPCRAAEDRVRIDLESSTSSEERVGACT